MPQLDKVTFLSQFFWLCFFYIGFYFLILKFFLPKMSLILKLRKKKLASSQDNVNNFIQENQKIKTNCETLFTNALNASKKAFNDNFTRVEKWLVVKQENTEKKHYQSLNKNYISSIGESSLNQNLVFNLFTAKIENQIYVYTLLKFLRNFPKRNLNPIKNTLLRSNKNTNKNKK